jgi:hypothetical protein
MVAAASDNQPASIDVNDDDVLDTGTGDDTLLVPLIIEVVAAVVVLGSPRVRGLE